MNTLYLVRHGENPANLTKELSHRRVDYSLTPKGILQAEQTAAWFRDKPIAALYTSPLKRARETAMIIGEVLGLEPIVIEEFREINCGTLEDDPASPASWALHNDILKDWFTGHPERAFPGGEDYPTLVARVGAGLREMVAGRAGQALIAIGHGGAFTCALPGLCPTIPIETLVAAHWGNCAITTVTLEPTGDTFSGALVACGDCAHLTGAAAEQVSPLPD